MSLQIHLLGSFEVLSDGESVVLPARKTEALLALLAFRPGVTISRERLTGLLWPDVPEAQGRTSLRQALGHLRKALPADLVVTSADRLHLDPTAAWVDSAELERLLVKPPLEREEVVPLWRGPLLEGFPLVEPGFADWLEGERVRIAERVCGRLEECLAALSAAGHIQRALAAGERVLELEPTRETAYRALMRLELARGERARAMRLYERCREALKRQLGVEPALETEALRAGITSGPPPADVRGATENDAKGVAPAALRSGRLILAVLPFVARAGTTDARLFADGLTEDLTTELARFRQLGLIARAPCESLGRRDASLEEIASETGAGLVLSGTVRTSEGRTRVTASLVDVTTGLSVWAERWDVDRTDLFGALDRLTRDVVAALALRIDETWLGQARRRPIEGLEAYECWLRGLECLRRGSITSDGEGRRFFEQALTLEPGFARAYSGLSLSYFNDWSCQAWDRWDDRERLAFENARRAVELDECDHVTQFILGRIYVYRREFVLGERHLEQALRLNPNDADALMHVGLGLTQLGYPERARDLSETALRLNPKHPDWYYPCAAMPLFFAGELEEAMRLALRAPDGHVDTRALLAAAFAHQGQLEHARAHLGRFLDHFRSKIVSDREPEPTEPARWLLHVNPLRRSEDRQYLLAGLSRAGLQVP